MKSKCFWCTLFSLVVETVCKTKKVWCSCCTQQPYKHDLYHVANCDSDLRCQKHFL